MFGSSSSGFLRRCVGTLSCVTRCVTPPKSLLFAFHVIALAAISCSILAAPEQDPAAYRLGSEDVLSIAVVRHPEFSGDYLVPADGQISLPAAGAVNVSGKTLKEVSEELTTRLGERLRQPEVSVTLRTARMQRAYVLGAVLRPGPYDAKSGWGIAEAVAAAGGLKDQIEPSDCTVTITSPGASPKVVDLAKALDGVDGANVPVMGGDTVNIDSVELLPVYVTGKVKAPGLLRVRKDSAGVLQALTLAGGTVDEAALSHVTVTHLSGQTEVIDLTHALIDGDTESATKLQAGDLIVVPESMARVAVLGFVNQPGFFPLKDGQKLTLSDALGLARGPETKRGGLSSVAIVRTQDGKQQRTTYNVAKFLKSGDTTQNPVIVAGDIVYVPETSKPNWDIVLRSLSTFAILVRPYQN
jgi:polysaccharide biosynthesis/export protein